MLRSKGIEDGFKRRFGKKPMEELAQKTIEMKEFEPRIVVLYCQNTVDKNIEETDSFRRLEGFRIRQVVMPCSSKVESRQLVKLLENGADAVLVVACPDPTCRFLVGSNRAERRIEYVRRILEEIDFGPERVAIVRKNGLHAEDLTRMAAERADAVRPLGPNPMNRESH